jgi:hypothetical protein
MAYLFTRCLYLRSLRAAFFSLFFFLVRPYYQSYTLHSYRYSPVVGVGVPPRRSSQQDHVTSV